MHINSTGYCLAVQNDASQRSCATNKRIYAPSPRFAYTQIHYFRSAIVFSETNGAHNGEQGKVCGVFDCGISKYV
jgi:hypothetical protein